MLYRIHVSTNNGLYPAISFERRRSDAAMLLAEKVAYDIITANGGLDTRQGHAAYAKVQAIDPAKGGTVEIYDRVLFFTASKGD